MVCRLSPSFIRFGNFQIHSTRGETNLLRQLADYTIRTDFPHLGDPGKDTYLRWFQEVCDRTRTLVIHWMRVGFVHGVLNTDNMSILGLTIDYGPYGWLGGLRPGLDSQHHGYRTVETNKPWRIFPDGFSRTGRP